MIAEGKGSRKKEYIRVNSEARKALEELQALYPDCTLVCPATTYENHRDWWKQVLEEAEVSGFRWHDLRHTFASRMAMAGRSLLGIKEAMRHKTIQMTLRYTHVMPSQVQEAVEAIVRKTTGTTTSTALNSQKTRRVAIIR